MSKSTGEMNLEERANLFKALGHPARLLMLNLIKQRPRHGEELAAILNLKPATVSHHLSKLADVGLLTASKNQYYQIYAMAGEFLTRPLGEIVQLSQTGLNAGAETDAYRQKVLKAFVRRGKLIKIPAQLKKRQVILEEIVKEFEPDQRYTEKEVNFILLDFHEDVATLRRGLIEHKLMKREKSIYWRTNDVNDDLRIETR